MQNCLEMVLAASEKREPPTPAVFSQEPDARHAGVCRQNSAGVGVGLEVLSDASRMRIDPQQLCFEAGGQGTSILTCLNLVIIACFSDDEACCEYPSLYYAYC